MRGTVAPIEFGTITDVGNLGTQMPTMHVGIGHACNDVAHTHREFIAMGKIQ